MIKRATEKDFDQLVTIWESAVQATHNFLSKEDFNYYKSQLGVYFKHVHLHIYKESQSPIKGFLGVADNKIEMLFVHNDYRGKGIGKQLLNFAINELHISKVDVNEQNADALKFYQHFGFKQVGRSDMDYEGKDYPIIFLSL